MIYAVQTSVGDRNINEDCLAAFDAPIGECFMVCDGLGGHGRGDAASQLVCAEFRNTVSACEASMEPETVLSQALMAAQYALRAKQEELRSKNAMMTTACALILTKDRLIYSHIGDSRIYIFDEKRSYIRTLDHSVPQALASAGMIKERAIRHHCDRNRVLRAMGMEWERVPFEVASAPRPLQGKGAVLMCTDGLWEWINEREMIRLKARTSSPDQWLEGMMLLAEKRAAKKNMDNHSGIAIFTAVR